MLHSALGVIRFLYCWESFIYTSVVCLSLAALHTSCCGTSFSTSTMAAFFSCSHGLAPANHYCYYCGLSWEVTVTGIRPPFLSPLFLAQKYLIYFRGPNNVYAHTSVGCWHVGSCSWEGCSPAIKNSTISR